MLKQITLGVPVLLATITAGCDQNSDRGGGQKEQAAMRSEMDAETYAKACNGSAFASCLGKWVVWVVAPVQYIDAYTLRVRVTSGKKVDVHFKTPIDPAIASAGALKISGVLAKGGWLYDDVREASIIR